MKGESFQGQTLFLGSLVWFFGFLFVYLFIFSFFSFSFFFFCPCNLSPCRGQSPLKGLACVQFLPLCLEKQVNAHPACLLVSTRAEQALLIQPGGLHGMPLHCLWDSFPYTVHCDHLPKPSWLVHVRVAPTSYLHGCLAPAQHDFLQHFQLLHMVLVHLNPIPFFVLGGGLPELS